MAKTFFVICQFIVVCCLVADGKDLLCPSQLADSKIPNFSSGILHLSLEDMQEVKKSMKEKGVKAEDVKILPPIEEIHGHEAPPPPKMVDVKYLMKFNDSDDPHNKHPSQ